MSVYFDTNVTQTIGLYSVTFKAVNITVAQDVLSVLAPLGRRIGLRAVYLNQYSDFGAEQAEIVSVQIVRGNTVAGSGGNPFTPLKLRPWFPAAGATCRINDTTLASGGIEEVVIADGWNVAAGWVHAPALADERVWIEPEQRACIRITQPLDGLLSNGTLLFEEVSA